MAGLAVPSVNKVVWGLAFGLLAVFIYNNVKFVNDLVRPRG